jgi:DNA polymerase III subunit delta
MTAKESSRQFMTQITSRDFAPAYLFWGDDEWRKDAALRELIKGAVDPASRDFNFDALRGAELDADGISTILGTPPMMAERRMVVIRDVSAMKKGARAALEKYLARPSRDVVLALTVPTGVKPEASLTSACFSLQINAVSGAELEKWITRQAQEKFGAQITPAAVALLQGAVGDDAGALMLELDKAASYVRGGTIDTDAIEAVVGIRHGETQSDLLDAIAARDVSQALALVEPVLALPKVTGVGLAMAIATQTAALGWGAAQRAKGVPLNRLAKDYFDLLKRTGAFPGRPWGEATAAWTKFAPRWSVSDAQAGLRAVLRADEQLKDTTVSNDAQILSTLVLTLCTGGERARG